MDRTAGAWSAWGRWAVRRDPLLLPRPGPADVALAGAAPAHHHRRIALDRLAEALSGIPTDLNENVVREYALAHGRVDVKVCAIDDVWSGLKHVIRKADR